MPLPRSRVEVIEKAVRAKLDGVYTTLPGIVQAYDAAKNLADVRLAVKVSRWSDDGDREYEEIETLPEVPVQWPRFNGYMVAGVLAVGDTVAVHFCSDAIGEWRVSGEVAEPVDSRRLSVGYPFCTPGLAPDSNPPGDAAARQAGLVIGKEGSDQQIRISGTHVEVGASLTVNLARGEPLTDVITQILACTPSPQETGLAAIKAALALKYPTNPIETTLLKGK